ncbi:unnamed protein product [Orchesella dallaii]|uniref:Uncharacterized protein n=1 Tax=Orchesella dallaii TaxID=48710 RepID=A0ABP1PSF7_9HEXA
MPRRRATTTPSEPRSNVIPLHIRGECYICDIFHNLQGSEGIEYHQPIIRTVDEDGNAEYVVRGINQPASDYERPGVVSGMRALMEGFEWPIQTAISGIVLFGAVFVLLILIYLQLFMWLG